MSSSTVLLLVILATVAVSMVIAFALVSRARARADAALAPLGTAQRTTAATALGTTSEEDGPLRGTGTLVVTATELGFAQWRPARLLRITRAEITRTDTTREHLGKSLKDDVLRVTWGPKDESVAFYVRDLDVWLADLGGTRSDPES